MFVIALYSLYMFRLAAKAFRMEVLFNQIVRWKMSCHDDVPNQIQSSDKTDIVVENWQWQNETNEQNKRRRIITAVDPTSAVCRVHFISVCLNGGRSREHIRFKNMSRMCKPKSAKNELVDKCRNVDDPPSTENIFTSESTN